MSLLAPTFRWVGESDVVDVAGIRSLAASLRQEVFPGGSVILHSGSVPQLVAALEGLDDYAGRVELVPGSVVPGVPSGGPSAETPGHTKWVIYTSGSTGSPSPCAHTITSLARRASRSNGAHTWGLVYDPYRLAGLSVVIQAMVSGSTLVDARAGTISSRIERMRAAGVDSLSATPTLWRQVLQSRESDGWDLRQVTLGGETVDQLTLDALAAAFPAARITHIFASSETGVAFSVTDGRAGFPLEFVDGIRLQVREGVLFVHNADSHTAGSDGFASTDDAVQVVDGRVHFAGRLSGMVNIGGSKVFPEQVESELRLHPRVADVVVHSRPNSFSGNILLAMVQPHPGQSTETLPGDLRRWAAERLPAPMVPARVSIVAEIPRSLTGKAERA